MPYFLFSHFLPIILQAESYDLRFRQPVERRLFPLKVFEFFIFREYFEVQQFVNVGRYTLVFHFSTTFFHFFTTFLSNFIGFSWNMLKFLKSDTHFQLQDNRALLDHFARIFCLNVV